jgi:hypothetical protein
MKKPLPLLAVPMLIGWCASAGAVFADEPPKPHHPAKAAASAPLTKPLSERTLIKSPSAARETKPTKPPVATAVAPKFPAAPVGQHGIIFVGGKPGDGKAALNPQPIPPGHIMPGAPVH